jgi:uncharacterized protein YdiU (UPF0061 family)
MNQLLAGNKNFCSLVDSVAPLLDNEHVKKAFKLKKYQYDIASEALNLTWAQKLGFSKYNSKISQIKSDLFELMELHKADFTLVWRQLTDIVNEYDNPYKEAAYSDLFNYYLENCFYNSLSSQDKDRWINWLSNWIDLLKSTKVDFKIVSVNMKKISPKFVPREWMLKIAYDKANAGDYSIVKELHSLFKNPYDEHSEEMTHKYYKKMTLKNRSNCSVAAKTFMSCSS